MTGAALSLTLTAVAGPPSHTSPEGTQHCCCRGSAELQKIRSPSAVAGAAARTSPPSPVAARVTSRRAECPDPAWRPANHGCRGSYAATRRTARRRAAVAPLSQPCGATTALHVPCNRRAPRGGWSLPPQLLTRTV